MHLEMVSETEKRKILYEFNNTKIDYPKDKVVHEIIEETEKIRSISKIMWNQLLVMIYHEVWMILGMIISLRFLVKNRFPNRLSAFWNQIVMLIQSEMQ